MAVYKGKYSTVYTCTLSNTTGKYAMKLISLAEKSPEIQTSLLQTFDQELQVLRKLKKISHPNVTRIIGFFKTNEKLALIKDLFDSSLQWEIEKQAKLNKTFDYDSVLDYSKQILSGLEFLHKYDIPHGNLKVIAIPLG